MYTHSLQDHLSLWQLLPSTQTVQATPEFVTWNVSNNHASLTTLISYGLWTFPLFCWQSTIYPIVASVTVKVVLHCVALITQVMYMCLTC